MKKKMTAEEKQKAEEQRSLSEETRARAELESTKELVASLERLTEEVASLKLQLNAIKRRYSSKIGIFFAVPGILSLVFSVVANSQVLAFIGLGLTFWGALFFLVIPSTYVRGSLLGLTADTLYSTIDRIAKDMDCKGKGLYIPPYPKGVYLPGHLEGLKETVVFLSAKAESGLPSIEELAGSKFITNKPRGVCLIPPGSGLVEQFEKTLRVDLSRMSLEDLCGSLPSLILEDFQLASEVVMRVETGQVYLKLSDSVFKSLYREDGLRSVRLLGCPLVSAVACAVARSSGKPTWIESVNVSPDTQTIEVSYRLKED
jgi:hypothetical protein